MPNDERARIRSIMYEPSAVWLATEYSGDRWITDQFVLYDVTGAEFLYCYDTSYEVQWPDGAYQLMATGEWRAKERDSVPEPDIEAYFGIMARQDWRPAYPSEWSVAEHPGKAMLWKCGIAPFRPCLLGESTWTAIKRHHPDALVHWAPNESAGTFRFSEVRHDGCNKHVYCGHRAIPFAYAAGIQIPEGQEGVAHAIAQTLDRISNERAA